MLLPVSGDDDGVGMMLPNDRSAAGRCPPHPGMGGGVVVTRRDEDLGAGLGVGASGRPREVMSPFWKLNSVVLRETGGSSTIGAGRGGLAGRERIGSGVDQHMRWSD